MIKIAKLRKSEFYLLRKGDKLPDNMKQRLKLAQEESYVVNDEVIINAVKDF